MPSTMIQHPLFAATQAAPTQTLAPAPAPKTALEVIADQLVEVDKSGVNIAPSLDAILKNTSYGPGDLAPKTLKDLWTALYSSTTVANGYDSMRLQRDVATLREADAQLQQIPAFQAQIAQLQQQVAAKQVPAVVPQSTPAAQSTNWVPLLVGVGVLAVLGVGAWYVMTHKKTAPAREPGERQFTQAQARRIFPPVHKRRKKPTVSTPREA